MNKAERAMEAEARKNESAHKALDAAAIVAVETEASDVRRALEKAGWKAPSSGQIVECEPKKCPLLPPLSKVEVGTEPGSRTIVTEARACIGVDCAWHVCYNDPKSGEETWAGCAIHDMAGGLTSIQDNTDRIVA